MSILIPHMFSHDVYHQDAVSDCPHKGHLAGDTKGTVYPRGELQQTIGVLWRLCNKTTPPIALTALDCSINCMCILQED